MVNTRPLWSVFQSRKSDMAEHHEVLQPILLQRAGLETIEAASEQGRVRIFGRVRSNRMPTWLMAVQGLLQASEHESSSGAAWKVDISKQYFLRGGKLFFGWRIILQAQSLSESLPRIIEVIQRMQPLTVQSDVIPLNAREDRNALRNGRGAQPTDKAVVGPLAKATLGM